ncbi:MAG: hypothetical protein CM15mP130_2830 [Verrucomicrobiota bacterium]|nr:MAG: hypothetical protein CM15mP130_2830 [Verrucomicrobiota bacterium]
MGMLWQTWRGGLFDFFKRQDILEFVRDSKGLTWQEILLIRLICKIVSLTDILLHIQSLAGSSYVDDDKDQ